MQMWTALRLLAMKGGGGGLDNKIYYGIKKSTYKRIISGLHSSCTVEFKLKNIQNTTRMVFQGKEYWFIKGGLGV